MNQKGFINIILILIIVTLVGAGAYFVSTRQTTPATPTPSPSPTPTPTPTPVPTPKPSPTPTPSPIPITLSFSELKYRLEGKLGKATFCGPPVVSSDYGDELLKQFPSVSADTEEFVTILKHLNIANDGSWTDQEKLTVVNEHNRLSAISLEPSNGKYKFSIRSRSQDKSEFIYEGFITQSGGITTTKQEAYLYGCPICLAGSTLIDTPSRLVPVKDLQVGMPIWTTDKAGHRVSGIVTKTSRVPVPPTHQMIHLVLDDGRELFVSPPHPTIDGRTVGNLIVNDLYDGAHVLTSERVVYGEAATYDILPSGGTGFYWANGILLDSTLH